MDWRSTRRPSVGGGATDAGRARRRTGSTTGAAGSGDREDPDSLPPEGWRAVREIVAPLAAKVLASATRIDEATALDSLGLDSLMAAELRNAVTSRLGVTFPMAASSGGPRCESWSRRSSRRERPGPSLAPGARRSPPRRAIAICRCLPRRQGSPTWTSSPRPAPSTS
jgi:acyl carrier protein